MAFKLSPSVEVSEIDLTLGVPAVATSIGAFAGPFVWGPVEEIQTVSSEADLVAQFGKPNNDVYAHWFSAANFLAYANNLKTVRVVGVAAKNAVSGGTAVLVKNETDWENSAGNRNYALLAKYPGSLGNSIGVQICKETAFAGWDFSGAFDSAPSDAASECHVVVYDTTGDWTGTAGTVLEKYAYASTVAGTLSADGTNMYFIDQLNSKSNYVWTGDELATDISTQLAVTTAPMANQTSLTVTFVAVDAGDIIDTTDIKITAREEVFAEVANEATFNLYSSAGNLSGATIVLTSSVNGALTAGSGQDYTITGNTVTFDATYNTNTGALANGEIITAQITAMNVTAAVNTTYNTGNYTSGYDKSTQSVRFTTVLGGVAQVAATTAALIDSSVTADVAAVYDVELTGGVDDNTGVDLTDGFTLFQDPETVDISLVITGPATTTEAEWALDNLGESRKDVVVFASPLRADIVGVTNPATILNNLVASGGYMDNFNSTSYGFMDANWKYQYDRYNDVYRWVPLNGDIAGLAARTDSTNDPWWAFAGFNRGQIKNVVKLAWNPNKTQRDELFKNRMNPVVSITGQGTVLLGDKTMLSRPSAFDAVNVRRLFIVLEKAIATAAKYLLFEFNDEFTQAQFRNLVEPFLRDVKGRRGIEDFRVRCDNSNNTGEVKQRREFIGDIYIKPNYAIRYVQLNFVAVRSDVSFSEIGA